MGTPRVPSWPMGSLSSLRTSSESALAAFTDPSGHYAFRTYDAAPLNTSDHLRPEDILMANLLSLRLGWRDVTPLFADAAVDAPPTVLRTALDRALVQLRPAPAFEDYSSVDEMQTALEPVAEANRATKAVSNWTPVTVSKVLHRHAPQSVPLEDSRVREFYGTSKGQSGALRQRMWEDIQENIGWLGPLASSTRRPDGRPLTVLRLTDILIWMSKA